MWNDNDNVQGVDTCKGDGGSPLTCKIQGRNSWVQVSHPSPSPDSHQSLSATNMERSKKSSLKLKFDLIDQCTIVNISQRGIVSWGIGCGEEGVPAVYANVAHVVCWIDDEVTFDTSAALNSIPPGEEILWGGEILSVWISPRGRLLGRWANVRLQVAAESTS